MRNWRSSTATLALMAALIAPVGVMAQPAGGMPPMMAGGSKPGPKTVALQKKAEQFIAAYKKKPNPKLKMQAAQAEYEYGYARMTDQALSPREKYRPALAAFRETLKLNPNHKQAKMWKDKIEEIYKGMGMPIPH